MNKLKGIIFDFDGTLADTLPVCILSFQQAFERVTGIKYSEKEITQYFGRSEEGIVAALAPDDYDKTLKTYIETYKKNHYLCPDLFDGIIEVLDELVKKKFKIALITGKGKHTIDIALESMNIKKYFEYVEHGHPEKSIKAECIDKISKLWKLNTAEVAYIGDQPADIIDCKTAGAFSIAVSWAKTSNYNKLLKHSPDLLFCEINQFKYWIQNF
ncbi:MAG TPA: HAD hydrolase-like protein [Candidatus Gastranaerophilales bacterium]|nr:HAD hydrolase-like protein [Candidatus Gastranaerophilales bacterium]